VMFVLSWQHSLGPAYCCTFGYFRSGSLSLCLHGPPGEIDLNIANVSSSVGDDECC
ncbi:MAG: hypothetical protein EZS28_050113, partial [Streblomastix strix]